MPVACFPVHWPCSKLSWELKQELRKRSGASYLLLLEFGSPLSLRYVWGPGVAKAGVGQYGSRLLNIKGPMRAASDGKTGLPTTDITFEIDDTNGAFVAAVDGPSGHLVQRCSATLTLGSLNVPQAQWFKAFEGVLHSWNYEGENHWSGRVTPNDLPLGTDIGGGFWPKPFIFGPDWPNADQGVLAQYGPLIYGQHDSSTTTAKGAVPLVYVDKTGFRYLASWARLKAVDAVYADGIKQASGWSVVYTDVGGRTCTLVKFTSDQGTKAITADVQGYETVGDGSGTLITEPTQVIRHALTNWIYNDYKTGLWFPESSAPIDGASFESAKVILSRNPSSKAARRIFGAQRRSNQDLTDWARSWQIRLFWTNSGKIGGRLEDNRYEWLYRDDQTGWIRFDQTPWPPSWKPEWERVIDRIAVDHHFQEAAAKYLYSLEVRDPTLTVENPENLQLPWSSATTY